MHLCTFNLKTTKMTRNDRFCILPEAKNNSKLRITCPQCGEKQVFTQYVDTQNKNTPLADHVGICKREHNCGYHFPPRNFFASGGVIPDATEYKKAKAIPLTKNVPKSYINASKGKIISNLQLFLQKTYGKDIADYLCELYNVGVIENIGAFQGATVFWQIRYTGEVAYGKAIQYDYNTGKRFKKLIMTAWNALNLPEIKDFEQCLFGEHLLRLYPDKPVYIHESEKTAIIATAVYPEYIHLACGGGIRVNYWYYRALQGRTGCLIPDVGKYESWYKTWQQITKEMPKLKSFQVTDMLENLGLNDGDDLADFILREKYPAELILPKKEPINDGWESILNEIKFEFSIK